MLKIGKTAAAFAVVLSVSAPWAPVYGTGAVTAKVPVTCFDSRTITMTPDARSPLPEKKTETAKSGKTEFAVRFIEPGTYHYTISDNRKTDYQLSVFVTNGTNDTLNAEVSATKDGKYKNSITFGKKTEPVPEPVKKTEKPKPKTHKKTVSVKTGDTTDIAKWCAAAGVAMLGAIAAIRIKEKERKKADNSHPAR